MLHAAKVSVWARCVHLCSRCERLAPTGVRWNNSPPMINLALALLDGTLALLATVQRGNYPRYVARTMLDSQNVSAAPALADA